MNGINISEIGVVALSQSEEYDIVGGWNARDCFKAAALTGLATGLGVAYVTGGAGFFKGFVAGAFIGTLVYTGKEILDYYIE